MDGMVTVAQLRLRSYPPQFVGATPTYCIMRKRELEKENEQLKAELENTIEILEMYRTVLNRVARKDIVQIELNRVFKELLCKR